jgi:toxin ParE1/3/4
VKFAAIHSGGLGNLHGTRKYLLRRFPYAVIYRVTDEAIEVVAVAHGRRRPGYWKTRRF